MSASPQVERFSVITNPGEPVREPDQTFEQKLIKQVQTYYDLTKTSRARRYYIWLIADLFSMACHYIDYDAQKGTVEEWGAERVARCMYTPVPLLQYAIEVIAAQYGTSNGRAVPMPTDTSDPKVKAVVRGLQDYADYLDWDFYHRDPTQRQTEAKLIPLRGVFNFLEYDKTKGRKVQVPNYQPQMASVCQDCGYEVADGSGSEPTDSGDRGDSIYPRGMAMERTTSTQELQALSAADEAPCPHCGSQNIQQMTLGVQNAGMIDSRQGAVVRHVVDPFQVEIYDRRTGIEGSKHLIYDEILFKTEAKKYYPWLKEIKGQATLGNYEHGFLGLHWLSQLQTLIANTGKLDQSEYDARYQTVTSSYYGSTLDEMMCWRRRCWLDPETYADEKLDNPTQFPGTDKVWPAGTWLHDVFPDGMVVHIMNGDLVVQLENQYKGDVWSYCGYRVPSAGMHGTGVSSLVALVRGNDEAHSIGMQALLMAALGIILIDERVQNFQNIPGRAVTVPLDANPLGHPMQNFGARLEMGGGAVISAAEPIKESYRGIIGDMAMAPNPQGSTLRPQGVGKETATAVRYNAGATGTLTGPPMEAYAAHRALVIEQTVELERVHNLRPRLYGKAGDTTARWFQPMEIPEDIKFGVAEESWRPRTLETEREDIGGAISLGVGTGQIADPKIEEKARRVFGLDDETDGYDDWAVLGEKRFDLLQAALPEVMQEAQRVEMELQGQPVPVDPMTGAPVYDPAMSLIEKAGVAPRPMDLRGHVHYARFYSEKYLNDEWDGYPPVLQNAIEKLFLMHQQGIGQAGAVETEIQVEAQRPAMEAQQQAQQEQQAGQQEQQAAEQQQGQESEEAAREHEGQQKMADHAMSTDAEERKHQRAMELEKMKHKHALEVEKVRASNRPKSGSNKKR